jgi:SAM-dependent methyltransferase
MVRAFLKRLPGTRRAVGYVRRLLRDHLGAPDLRAELAHAFLTGEGIEIGAFNNPQPLPPSVRVRYVDRIPLAELRQDYCPEPANAKMAPVHVVDDGEKLTKFEAESEDFIVANHFIEHTEDPIGTIKRFLEVLRPQGVLFMAVPDMRFTFDKERPLTTMDHLLRDYTQGPEWSREGHFREVVEVVNHITGDALEPEVRRLMDMNYCIHFHVWNAVTLMQFLSALQTQLALSFDIEAFVRNKLGETILVLRRA